MTLWRTVSPMDPEEFERVVEAWFKRQRNDLPKVISIDGKALRATLDEKQKGHYAVNSVSYNFSSSHQGIMPQIKNNP